MAKPSRLKNLDPLVSRVAADPNFIALEAGGDQGLLDRLLGRPEMESVWDDLSRLVEKRGDDHLPLDLLTLTLALPRHWARTDKTRTAEAKKTLRDVEDTARKLSRQLQAHSGLIRLLAGYDTDLHSIIVELHRTKGRRTTAKQVQKLDWSTINRGGQPAIPQLPQVLDALADKLKEGRKKHRRPIGGRPTKPNEPMAHRTYYVQQLAEFFEERDMDVPFAVIAEIVNVMVDDPSSFLTPRHVELLLKG